VYSTIEQPYREFIERAQVLAVLDHWLVNDSVDCCVILHGSQGIGKTAILASWLARRGAARDLVPHHFVRRQHSDRVEPSVVARSLATQIEERYPELRDPYARPEARLAELLARVSARELAPRGARLVLVVDGLDERQPMGNLRHALQFLPRALPPGVRLLCATQSGDPGRDGFESRPGRLVHLDLDDPSLSDDNEAIVREFWCREALELALDSRFAERAVRCAGGNMLHATLLQRHLANAPQAQRGMAAIPRGLPALLDTLWQRIAGDPTAVRILGILSAAHEPLSLDQIGRVAGSNDLSELRAAIHVARELVVEIRRGSSPPTYRLLHDAIRGHVIEQLGPAGLRERHQNLADRLATWPAQLDAAARRYTLQHGVGHRIAAGDCQAIHALASSIDFLAAKRSMLGVDDVELDVRRAVEACFAAGQSSFARDLDGLARAIASESIALRRDDARAAEVWNRLRRTAPRPIDVELRGAGSPDDSRKLRDLADTTPTVHATTASVPEVAAPGPPSRAIKPTTRGPVVSKHLILFLAANPKDTSRLDLERECAAIEHELHLARHGSDFEFRSKWVVTVDEMARHLIDLDPAIVHFSGHGRRGARGPSAGSGPSRDGMLRGESGIYLHDEHQGVQLVTGRALALMIQASAPSARLVVLNACYSDDHSEALCQVAECVVGMTSAISDQAARSFAVAFYRGLGHRHSVGGAVEHARATLEAKGLEADVRCRSYSFANPCDIHL
jgi:hypothetical protein